MLTSILVVFDLDGTLIDSRADLAAATNATLHTYGQPPLPEDQVTSFVGEGARVLVSRAMAAAGLGDHLVDEALVRFLDLYNTKLLNKTRLYDGVAELITWAQTVGVTMGVITNKPQAPTDRLLHALELAPFFHWVIGGDTELPRKPDPTSLLWMMEEAGFEPQRTLFVGDSPIDADTARGAGTHFCLAAYGFGQQHGPTALGDGEFRANTVADIRTAIDAVRGAGGGA